VLASQAAVVRPRWTTASFLLYAGGFVVLAATAQAFGLLADDYGDAGFAGWTALIFVLLTALAVSFHGAGKWIAAGIFAFSAVIAWGVFVGALEAWFGWLPRRLQPFHGFHLGLLLIPLLVLAVALAALRILRFPLLVVPVVAATYYFVTDLISGGGNWSAVVTLLYGLVLYAIAVAVDAGPARPYGFWLHAAAGVAVGGAFVFFGKWPLIAVAGLAFIAVAVATRRSSYAVLGAYGLYLSTIHFAGKWSGEDLAFYPYLPFFLFFPFEQSFYYTSGTGDEWVVPLTFAFLGFLLVAIGLLLERRDRATV
jgi:hypothetical protein